MPESIERLDVALVMAVYRLVDPHALSVALESVSRQTSPPREIKIVADGELTPALEQVLAEFLATTPVADLIRQEHRGSGPAKQRGLEACSTEYVAIADADDVNAPDRLETQGARLYRERLDLLGAAMLEVDLGTGDVLGLRRFPERHEQLVGMLRSRNPFNHPTIVVRRSLALRVGGYRSLAAAEDYDLWARMVGAGARVGNCPEALVTFGGGAEMLRRRRGWHAIRDEWKLQRSLHEAAVVPRWMMPINWAVRNGFRLLPSPTMGWVYRRVFLRSRSTSADA